jgi:cellulose synthase/poly-beta-1,6-N-acetylglucosamine synthase-like glycosyltransferase
VDIIGTMLIINLTLICLYSFHRLVLLVSFLKLKASDKSPESLHPAIPSPVPAVTVQLPIYNEPCVVEHLLEHISRLHYPKGKLDIQILDDSDDETSLILQKKIHDLRSKGCRISYLQRQHRRGFKAGALRHGTHYVKGEFLAIFDADFIPNPDFLTRTIPLFIDYRVACVQTKPGFRNWQESWVTRVQDLFLNMHAVIEQWIRFRKDRFLQFNGTCAVWRKQAIEDCGGWKAASLAEDLEISYRVQRKGWKLVYINQSLSYGLYPSVFSSWVTQQARWARGHAEVIRLLLSQIGKWETSLREKFALTLSLITCSYVLHVLIATYAILSLAMFFTNPSWQHADYAQMVFLASFSPSVLLAFTANVVYSHRNVPVMVRFAFFTPVFIAYWIIFVIGFSFRNTIEFFQGILKIRAQFVRTPKYFYNNSLRKRSLTLTKGLHWSTLLDFGFLCLFFCGIFLGVQRQESLFLPTYVLFAIGLTVVIAAEVVSFFKNGILRKQG